MSKEKSHSFKSNFILTLLALYSALGLPLAFVGISLLANYMIYGIIMCALGIFILLTSLLLFNKFTR